MNPSRIGCCVLSLLVVLVAHRAQAQDWTITTADFRTRPALLQGLSPDGVRSVLFVSGSGGASATLRYRVRHGDTLELIADRFEVTAYQIRRWNGLRSSQLVVGRTLILYVPAASSRGNSRARTAKSRDLAQSHARRLATGTAVQPIKTRQASNNPISVKSPSAR